MNADRADTCIEVPVRRAGHDASDSGSDLVAVEEPLEIRLRFDSNGVRAERSIAITMRTPGFDADLALGFLFTEGVIADRADVSSVQRRTEAPAGKSFSNSLTVELAPGIGVDLGSLERNFYTTSSCGVCGKASIDALQAHAKWPVDDAVLRVSAAVLSDLPNKMAALQSDFARTGSLHAAAVFDAQGEVFGVREDVGRHNALDKLIGELLRADQLPLRGRGVLLSGRASFELLQKCRMAACPVVATVGAPSSLAVELAWEFDMTLVGFLRDGRFNVYAGPARIA